MRSIHFLIQTRAIFMHHSTADEHNGQVAIEGKTHRRYRRLGSDYRYLVFLCTIQLMYKASSRISAPVLPTFLFGSLRSQTVYLNLVARLILVRAWRKAEIRFHRVSARIKGGGDSPLAHDDGNFLLKVRAISLMTASWQPCSGSLPIVTSGDDSILCCLTRVCCT